MTKIVNLTPHALNVYKDDAVILTVESSGVARVGQSVEDAGSINDIPVRKSVWGEVEGIPDPKDGVIYVVSALVRTRVADRDDVVSPDTSPSGAVRDDAGRIVGVRGFLI